MQAILLLRPVYKPAVQPCKTNRMISAMPDVTLSSSHHHLPRAQRRARKARFTFKPLKPILSIRDYPGPQTAVYTRCKARHWECERMKLTKHLSSCCSQGNLKLKHFVRTFDSIRPPVFRVLGRFYHLLSALIPAVHQRPAFAQTWLIEPAEATDTRLGIDGADIRIQRSTVTKLKSILRTGTVRNETRNTLKSGSCASAYHHMASSLRFLLAGPIKLGRRSPENKSRSTKMSNSAWCARYLPVLV
ncbi:BQ5605_C025g09960 [Microbotryum silenes-dioicae]|uniref:BQ5605_C025g09960 protein n=1 Tax=Microbotryum silenes-dioicae TaxID=796604 RepID=A0A2X0NF01_9BASI|nr:BQ5605_C025g09960 [Microbotryum silenes-dioicae]